MRVVDLGNVLPVAAEERGRGGPCRSGWSDARGGGGGEGAERERRAVVRPLCLVGGTEPEGAVAPGDARSARGGRRGARGAQLQSLRISARNRISSEPGGL